MAAEQTSHVVIYTDGSSRGNPGPGGYGAVLSYVDRAGEEHVKELSGGYELTTNNRMELLAVICGLGALKKPCQVDVYSDSTYVVDAVSQHWLSGWMKKGWKTSTGTPVANQDLWMMLADQLQVHQVRFIKVKGHADNEMNNRCDELARGAIKKYLAWEKARAALS